MVIIITDLINILILSTIAGLATGIGGLIVLIKKPGEKSFGFLTGFAAGIMIVLSFFGLMIEAWESAGFLIATASFAVGAIFMFFLDSAIPHIHFQTREKGILKHSLFKTGILIAIGITFHNIPEGISVGAGYLHLPAFGIWVATAIALHNIPEGIAIALPLYRSGVSKLSSFKIALLSGLGEPAGALLAALILGGLSYLIAPALAFAAGVMVFITLDELIPLAYKHGHEHFTAAGIIVASIIAFLLIGIFAF